MHPKTTDELLKVLNSITTTSDLEDYTQKTTAQTPALPFHEYINMHLKDSALNASQLIQQAQIQRTYGYQILNGNKNPGRDKVIALCLALSLSLEETQRALTLAGEGALYPKSKRDSVIIFSINKRLSVQETNELLYQVEEEILV